MRKKGFKIKLPKTFPKPRTGVHPTKVDKDKSKYNRKEKHKKKWNDSKE